MYRQIFAIHKRHLLAAAIFFVAVFFLQYLMVSKFWELFADYTSESFPKFLRNYHMAGFDPITYDVITHWHAGYDVLRHPLLAWIMVPVHWLNSLLWSLSGMNCATILTATILGICSFYSLMWLYRMLCEYQGLSRTASVLLTMMFCGFSYVMTTMVVADHFALSQMMLILCLYLAAQKIHGGKTFSAFEIFILMLLTAGITLSNIVPLGMMILITNGRNTWVYRNLVAAGAAVVLLFASVAVTSQLTSEQCAEESESIISMQTKWIREDVSKIKVLQENFFGESLQFHRKHILGDVLRDRPLIVSYTWVAQDMVVIFIEVLMIIGIIVGIKRKETWICLCVLGFNMLLHIIMGFAIDEVQIMTAHWAFTIPMLMANVMMATKARWRMALFASLTVLTLYLLTYNGYLLYRYLTWPLV